MPISTSQSPQSITGNTSIGSNGVNVAGAANIHQGYPSINVTSPIQSSNFTYIIPKPFQLESNSPDLPKLFFYSKDDHGNSIQMELVPEYQMSPHEALLLTRLVIAAQSGLSQQFSAFAFVKKNNLERHFKYSNG